MFLEELTFEISVKPEEIKLNGQNYPEMGEVNLPHTPLFHRSGFCHWPGCNKEASPGKVYCPTHIHGG